MNKRKTWEWIKKNDPALKKFLLDAPKGFVVNVKLEGIDGSDLNEGNGKRTGSSR